MSWLKPWQEPPKSSQTRDEEIDLGGKVALSVVGAFCLAVAAVALAFKVVLLVVEATPQPSKVYSALALIAVLLWFGVGSQLIKRLRSRPAEFGYNTAYYLLAVVVVFTISVVQW